MNRTEVIKEYAKRDTIGDNSILYALIRCLPADEATCLLLESIPGDLLLRNAALKIVLEHASENWSELFENLVDKIIEQFSVLPSNRKAAHFYCLGEFAEIAPSKTKNKIILYLLNSKFALARRKGLKLIQPTEVNLYKQQIESCVWNHEEFEALKIMVSFYPEDYLYENRSKLKELIQEEWLLGRLFLRISTVYPDCINELSIIDLATYAYVKAKRGIHLCKEEVENLIETYRLSDRFGLVIWALGKLGYWDDLIYISDQYEKWVTEKYRS